MLFGQDRNAMRKVFFDAWQKKREQQALEPMEAIIAQIIELHPEYHSTIETPESSQDKDYTPEGGETNPFLHMGMHIAIHEQMSTNRPAGIQAIYQQLLTKIQDPHEVEHKMMDALGLSLWQAQRDGVAPDEQQYLESLKRLA